MSSSMNAMRTTLLVIAGLGLLAATWLSLTDRAAPARAREGDATRVGGVSRRSPAPGGGIEPREEAGLPAAVAGTVVPEKGAGDDAVVETDTVPLPDASDAKAVIDALLLVFPDLAADSLHPLFDRPQAETSFVVPWEGSNVVHTGEYRPLRCERLETTLAIPEWAVLPVLPRGRWPTSPKASRESPPSPNAGALPPRALRPAALRGGRSYAERAPRR